MSVSHDIDHADLIDMVEALTMRKWDVDRCSLYDTGVEGWIWTTPNGDGCAAIGDWDEIPPWPDSARDALNKERGPKR